MVIYQQRNTSGADGRLARESLLRKYEPHREDQLWASTGVVYTVQEYSTLIKNDHVNIVTVV